jgi:hypothetical protein
VALRVRRGDLDTSSGHLRTLIGRPTTALTEALTTAIKAA